MSNYSCNVHISIFISTVVLHVLSPETYLGHFYFLWFFLFSLHPVADQTGAAPITCQRNVPALPSITSLTRAGRAVARSIGPQRAPGAAAPCLVNWLGFTCECAWCACTDQHTGLRVYEASTQPVVPSRDPTCPTLLSGLCDVCGLDRAFQRVHHQPGRKRRIWHVSTGIPVTWEMCPAGN